MYIGRLPSTGLAAPLARAPRVGWMSWETFRCGDTSRAYPANQRDSVHVLHTAPVGRCARRGRVPDQYLSADYDTIHVDDCWEQLLRRRCAHWAMGQLVTAMPTCTCPRLCSLGQQSSTTAAAAAAALLSMHLHLPRCYCLDYTCTFYSSHQLSSPQARQYSEGNARLHDSSSYALHAPLLLSRFPVPSRFLDDAARVRDGDARHCGGRRRGKKKDGHQGTGKEDRDMMRQYNI
jgi:hypothetical protein